MLLILKSNEMFVPIDKLVNHVNTLPKENFFYEGIKENSLNLIVAPSKVGKTTWAENLCMCIAAGHNEYLGKEVWFGNNQKTLMISLEEFYRGRTERNKQQLLYMDKLVGHTNWHSNFYVTDIDIQRYIETMEHWDKLEEAIGNVGSAFTVIDSLSRLHGNSSIEDSAVGIDLMKKLRHIVEKTRTTLLVIHHTHKIENEPLTLFNMAGTRIISQEADAVIGMNKTPSGKRYVKPLAFRYADDSTETVQMFKRNEFQWLIEAGIEEEHKLLREFDSRIDSGNADEIYDFIVEQTGGDRSVIITTGDLVTAFVESEMMTNPTLHASLRKLINDKKIVKPGKGQYQLSQEP
jgi:hypothetical protein